MIHFFLDTYSNYLAEALSAPFRKRGIWIKEKVRGFFELEPLPFVPESRASKMKRKRRRFLTQWREEDMIEVLTALKNAGIPLIYSSILRNSSEQEAVIFRVLRRKVKGMALYTAACKLFGSWKNALAAAGLELPDGRSKDFGSIPDVVTEFTKMPDGQFRKMRFLGKAPRTPEEEVRTLQVAEDVEKAVEEAFSASERPIVKRVLDLITDADEFSNTQNLIEWISERMDGVASTETIASIFRRLRGSRRPQSHTLSVAAAS